MFPLFELPLLPLIEIVKSYSLKEIVLLSMTSSRSLRIMKTLLKHMRYCDNNNMIIGMAIYPSVHKITVTTGHEKFNIHVNDKNWMRTVPSCEKTFKNTKYFLDDYKYGFKTYWQDDDKAIQMFYNHISELFGAPITNLVYNPSEEKLYLDLLETVLYNQDAIPQCSVGLVNLSEKNSARVLNHLQKVQNLSLSSNVLNCDASKFKLQNLMIEDGDNISFQKLIELNCESIGIFQHCYNNNALQNKNLNSYLRRWKAGFFPRLKNFRLETKASLTLPNILRKIPFELSADQIEIDGEDTVLTAGPLNIRNVTNGKIGTVYIMDTWNEHGHYLTIFEFSVEN
ncbi:hypothetical protein CAEBREN_05759 [Caenorhabditis brenneri]|uniref:Sdz-33 F-box domain-containing protein n=1 Tax=Caenorhabditis brenneri TaxID=135651 RepID=G0NYB0_CAEBE|nr:hypothetical protein CAEBREN_05759 [Caenorhabditis brenneri]